VLVLFQFKQPFLLLSVPVPQLPPDFWECYSEMAWFHVTILAAIAAVVLSEIGCVPFIWGTASEVVVLFLFAEDHLLSKTSCAEKNATCARFLVLTTTAAMIVFRVLIFLVAAAGGAGILIDGGNLCNASWPARWCSCGILALALVQNVICTHDRIVWCVDALQQKTTPIRCYLD
jgi:hypothetical protein